MPGIDGYEVCRRIRADERTAFLPVVMITASGSQERLAALEAGADDFVQKPFDQAELRARVASLSRMKRYHDTIRRQADELARWNVELEDRVRTPGRRARTARSAAPLPVPPARRPRRRLRRRGPAGEPPPRDRGALLRPARLHRLRAHQRAGGGDVRAARVPHPARPPRARVRRDAGAVHRRRGDGVLQRPAALRGPGGARRTPGRRGAGGDARRRRAVGRPRARPRARHRDRAGLRDPGPDRLRGPLRLRGDRQRHEPGGAAVRPRPRPGRSWSAGRCTWRSSTRSTTSWSATCSRAASAVPCGCTTSGRPTATR